MIETIKQSIEELPFISFGSFYNNYVLQVEDDNIDEEIRYLFRNNEIDPLALNRLINEIQKGFQDND